MPPCITKRLSQLLKDNSYPLVLGTKNIGATPNKSNNYAYLHRHINLNFFNLPGYHNLHQPQQKASLSQLCKNNYNACLYPQPPSYNPIYFHRSRYNYLKLTLNNYSIIRTNTKLQTRLFLHIIYTNCTIYHLVYYRIFTMIHKLRPKY